MNHAPDRDAMVPRRKRRVNQRWIGTQKEKICVAKFSPNEMFCSADGAKKPVGDENLPESLRVRAAAAVFSAVATDR
jgi:hypothetical protein